jgi:hypothetical protein
MPASLHAARDRRRRHHRFRSKITPRLTNEPQTNGKICHAEHLTCLSLRGFVSYSKNIVVRQSSNTESKSPWKLVLALLCIALVIACGTIQAIHVHADGDLSHADCPLCATAHVAVQVVEPPVTLHVAPVISLVEAYLPAIPSRTLSIFALFTRPPPVDALAA